MTHPSKRKGNGFERELVQLAEESGIVARRAYGSNGESLGHHAEVDVVVDRYRIQAKRRHRLPAYLTPGDNVDVVAVREDCGPALVIITYADWLDLIKGQAEQAEIPPHCNDYPG